MYYAVGILTRIAIDFSNYRLTKSEAKNQLDMAKEVCKHFLNPQEHQFFSTLIDVSKVGVDSRVDVPKDRIFIPYNIGYRTYYIEQYVW